VKRVSQPAKYIILLMKYIVLLSHQGANRSGQTGTFEQFGWL
jgi:hypothetical protein